MQYETVDTLAFENGTTMLLEDTPPALRREIDLYNAWTLKAQELAKYIEDSKEQLEILEYARSNAYSRIHQEAGLLNFGEQDATPENHVVEADGELDQKDPAE